MTTEEAAERLFAAYLKVWDRLPSHQRRYVAMHPEVHSASSFHFTWFYDVRENPDQTGLGYIYLYDDGRVEYRNQWAHAL